MNNFSVVGRITKNPELRYTKENKPVCEVSIAIQNGKDDTTFIPITLFGKTAEATCKYCKKGDLIGAIGIIKNHIWEDNKGNKRYDYTFMANKVNFLQSKVNTQTEEKTTENSIKTSDEQIYADFGDSIEITDDMIAF